MKYTAVLFDLDGTITDSGPYIISNVAKTLAELGLPAQSETQLKKFIGPPLEIGFMQNAGLDEKAAIYATEVYRGHYTTRMLETPIFEGIAEVIKKLSEAGVPLAIATSKLESIAVALLEHNDLAKYFQVISGAMDDGSRASKTSVVRHALDELERQGYDISRGVILGDRLHDVEGALENNIDAIGCAWAGYGSLTEFEKAVAIIDKPSEILEILGL